MKHWSWLLATFIVLSFVSCKTKTTSETNNQTQTVIDFNQTPINWMGLWQNRESKKELINSVIREFEIQHQHYDVNFKYQEEIQKEFKSNKDIIEDSIIAMIKSGNYTWDIIPLTQKGYSSIAKRLNNPEWGKKYLVNFEEFDWFVESHIKKVFDVSNYRDDFGGIFAGPLIEGRNYGLWYNTATAEKLGIEVKQTGMTFNDFLGYCKSVNEYNKTAEEKITFLPDWKLNSQVTDIFNQLVLSEIGETNNKLPKRSVALKAVQKALEALEKLSKYTPINPDVNVDKNFVYNLNGQVLFAVKPSSWYNQCESEDKEKALLLVPSELPVFEKPAAYYRGSYQSVWAVFKNSPHKDMAIELMKYFSSADVAERWLSTTYNPTAIKAKLNASEFGLNDIEKFNTYIENKYGDNLVNFNLGDILFGKNLTIDPLKVITGEMSAAEFYTKNISTLNIQK